MSFVPHFHIISLNSNDHDTTELCLDKEMKFCAADPDGPGPATGRKVVEEDLRQICLFSKSEKWQGSTS